MLKLISSIYHTNLIIFISGIVCITHTIHRLLLRDHALSSKFPSLKPMAFWLVSIQEHYVLLFVARILCCLIKFLLPFLLFMRFNFRYNHRWLIIVLSCRLCIGLSYHFIHCFRSLLCRIWALFDQPWALTTHL